MDEYEKHKKILELKLKVIKEMANSQYDKAQNYTNIIILAGFAAFFTILTNIANDLPSEVRIKSAIAMGISCMIFILWELFKMIYYSLYVRKIYIALAKTNTDEEYEQKLNNLAEFEDKYNGTTGRAWIYILVATIIPGLYGTITLLMGGMALVSWY